MKYAAILSLLIGLAGPANAIQLTVSFTASTDVTTAPAPTGPIRTPYPDFGHQTTIKR